MKKVESKYVVVAGCGRLGAHLAGELSRRGHSIVVIDANEAAFSLLPVEFGGFRLEGDATEMAVLRQAKTDRAESLIAVTADDNVNLAVAQVAKHVFRVPEVLARVSDPRAHGDLPRAGRRYGLPDDAGVRSLARSGIGARKEGERP